MLSVNYYTQPFKALNLVRANTMRLGDLDTLGLRSALGVTGDGLKHRGL